MQLKDKWALITGSTRGIGQQVAVGLAIHGCNIIVHGRELEHAEQTLKRLRTFPVQTFVVAGELGNIEAENAFTEQILEHIGHIDILYNNAAIMAQWHDQIYDIPMDEWHRVFEVNLFSMIRLCNRFIPIMKQRNWGRVINLSTGMQDTPQLAPYSLSKAAVDKYTLDLAADCKGSNVLVNAVDPGWLKTDLGGEYADYEVESVLPGALIPALLEDDSTSGKTYQAQDYATQD